VMPCGYFRGTYNLHLQGQKVSQTSNIHSMSVSAHNCVVTYTTNADTQFQIYWRYMI
jgi:hypothetical protein